MRYLVISDIHSNLEAFKSVLAFCKRKKYGKVLFLGDLVGYGASPNRVVEEFRGLKNAYAVRGNHDKVCSGIEAGLNFNEKAKIAAHWTYEKLSDNNLRMVRDLPRGPLKITEDITISHGSPNNEDFYIFSEFDAYQMFSRNSSFVTFFGHTHIPSIFEYDGDIIHFYRLNKGDQMELKRGHRYLINPGSVGQPRDRNPMSSFLFYDSEKLKVYYYRVRYQVETAQRKIIKEGLPEHLASRLIYGV